jgi:exportin-7
MLGYLASKGPTLEPFVISGFIQLLCRVTKLGWFDEGDVMRQLVTETTKFLEVCPGFVFVPCT